MIKAFLSVLLVSITLLTSSCSHLQQGFLFKDLSKSPELSIEQASEEGQSGQYNLYGIATLPDGLELTVSAIRILGNEQNNSSSESIPYRILDRTVAEVENGRWQTTLSLWQNSPKELYQEDGLLQGATSSSQSSQRSTITFLVAVEPDIFTGQWAIALETLLDDQKNPILNFTSDGEPYLIASKSLPVSLPLASQIANAASSDAPALLWKNRTSLSSVGSVLERPLESPFLEGDNLPLPSSNILR